MFQPNRLCVLLLLLFFGAISPASSAEEVLYCADDGQAGFEPTEEYKLYRFEPKRFTVKIDFETNSITSDKLFFTDPNGTVCLNNYFRPTVVYCLNDFGATFGIDRDTLKYARSMVFLTEPPVDSIAVAYGSCEKF